MANLNYSLIFPFFRDLNTINDVKQNFVISN